MENGLTEKQIEEQEHLNEKRHAMLNPKYAWGELPKVGERPTQELIKLMHWAKRMFCDEISTKEDSCEIFIHNKIVIDGAFLQFCEEKKIKVECIYKDSIASWQSDHDYEHFMAQGVFKIKSKKSEFLHCALFHKGNQNEDEVSFFIILNKDKFYDYLSVRNEYDEWLKDRDRNNLEVHVVGGEGYPYTKDLKWDELFLPEILKKDIISSVEGFLASKEIYERANIPWKRGILLFGPPGNGKSSTIKTIMANYDFKPVTVMSSVQTNDDMITEAFEYAQEQEPGLLYIEDLDTLLSGPVTLSHFLNLMDGVSSKNGIMVIATANDLSRLNEAILDRPSRFDRKWEVPLPDLEMSKKYLVKWFGESIKQSALAKIAVDCVKKKFSYAYLKELYITSAYNALAAGRDQPNQADLKAAMSQLIRDKNRVETNFESDSKEDVGIF